MGLTKVIAFERGMDRTWAGWLILLSCAVGFLVQVTYYYPGAVSHDAHVAVNSLQAGQSNDWHSPLMAYWMVSAIGLLPDGLAEVAPTVSVLAVFWVGLWLTARGLFGISKLTGVLAALVGWFPPLFMTMFAFGKDSLMVACLTFALGCALSVDSSRRGQTSCLFFFGWCFLLAAITIRTNAVFAIFPILYIAVLARKWSLKFWGQLAATVMLWISLVVSSQILTYHVFKAEQAYPLQYVMVSDLFAMNLVRDEFELPPLLLENTPALTAQVFEERHTLGPMVDWALWGDFDINLYQVKTDEEFQTLRDFWLERMASDVGSYLSFKAKFFNSLMTPNGDTAFRWVLFQGWWYLLAMLMLFGIFLRRLLREDSFFDRTGMAFVLSGLVYLLPYTLLQGGAGFRFLLWCVAATVFGLIMLAASMLFVADETESKRPEFRT
ncbi:MAG: hypothetical protein AAF541_09785 [Pseudomonadota bacterium]